ncbi:head-tail joining protein [Aquitalea magnusonii]|jgi:hypothetical protein|uniref:Phage protein n=1 Tax=Aquitalea magnusonii TaxID=332411 RepID=A0A318K5Y4_9NEIS|nr:hypothetical protein [Aquitalea magnusonii]PXX49376.1 hypothetical protein DFR38_10415 [Aquitalea magnusonii]
MIDWDKQVLGPVIGVFGEPAEITPQSGSPYSVSGVFDEAYKAVDGFSGVESITSVCPVFGIQASACPARPQQGDAVTIIRLGITYLIRDIHDDGHGHLKLLMNYASGG